MQAKSTTPRAYSGAVPVPWPKAWYVPCEGTCKRRGCLAHVVTLVAPDVYVCDCPAGTTCKHIRKIAEGEHENDHFVSWPEKSISGLSCLVVNVEHACGHTAKVYSPKTGGDHDLALTATEAMTHDCRNCQATSDPFEGLVEEVA